MMRRWLVIAALVTCAGCNKLLFFLPELRDGKHYTQPTTAVDINRGQDVAACLERWAHSHGYPNADYSDVDFTKLVIVGVGDPGVAGADDFVAGRESGDTVFIPLRTLRSAPLQAIAIFRHEDVHIVQQSHKELIGANGDIHWAPPFDTCQIPRYIIAY